MRALAFISMFVTALLLGMFVISTPLEFGLAVALFALFAVGVTVGSAPRTRSETNYEQSRVHLGKTRPRRDARYDIFSDK